jgi:hypothetical protein
MEAGREPRVRDEVADYSALRLCHDPQIRERGGPGTVGALWIDLNLWALQASPMC